MRLLTAGEFWTVRGVAALLPSQSASASRVSVVAMDPYRSSASEGCVPVGEAGM